MAIWFTSDTHFNHERVLTFTVPSTLDQTSEAKAGIQQMLLSALQAYQPTNPAEVAYKQALLAL